MVSEGVQQFPVGRGSNIFQGGGGLFPGGSNILQEGGPTFSRGGGGGGL